MPTTPPIPSPTLPSPTAPEPFRAPAPPASAAPDLLTDLLSPAFSLPDLALRHNLSLSQLTARITSPDFLPDLAAIADLAAFRARMLATMALPSALLALDVICRSTAPPRRALPQSPSAEAPATNPAPPPAADPPPQLRIRHLEISRKAATSLLSFASAPPPTPRFTTTSPAVYAATRAPAIARPAAGEYYDQPLPAAPHPAPSAPCLIPYAERLAATRQSPPAPSSPASAASVPPAAPLDPEPAITTPRPPAPSIPAAAPTPSPEDPPLPPWQDPIDPLRELVPTGPPESEAWP